MNNLFQEFLCLPGSDAEDELEESGVKVSEEQFNFHQFILR